MASTCIMHRQKVLRMLDGSTFRVISPIQVTNGHSKTRTHPFLDDLGCFSDLGCRRGRDLVSGGRRALQPFTHLLLSEGLQVIARRLWADGRIAACTCRNPLNSECCLVPASLSSAAILLFRQGFRWQSTRCCQSWGSIMSQNVHSKVTHAHNVRWYVRFHDAFREHGCRRLSGAIPFHRAPRRLREATWGDLNVLSAQTRFHIDKIAIYCR